jgi:enoyl-CoA hydratase/carnithine racemase
VTRVVADADLREKTMEMARRLVVGHPATYAYIKENMNTAESATLEFSIEQEARNMMLARRALLDAAKDAEAAKPKAAPDAG